jgi:hypothetical protein
MCLSSDQSPYQDAAIVSLCDTMFDLVLQPWLGSVDDHIGLFTEGEIDAVAVALQDQLRCL